MTIFFSQKTRDGGEPPVLIWFVKFSGRDTGVMKTGTDQLKVRLIASRQGNVRGVSVRRTTEEISMFQRGVTGLNCLLCEWEIATGNCVEIRLGDLQLHGMLRLVR
jgi:hypothetical protein